VLAVRPTLRVADIELAAVAVGILSLAIWVVVNASDEPVAIAMVVTDAITTSIGVEVGVIVRVGVEVGVGVLDPVLTAVGDGMGIGPIPTDALRTGALPTRASRDALDSRMKWPLPAPRVKLLGGTPHQWLSHPPATQRASSITVP